MLWQQVMSRCCPLSRAMHHTGTVLPSSCWPPSSAPSRWAPVAGEPHQPLMGTAGPSPRCTPRTAGQGLQGLPRTPPSAQSHAAACRLAAAAPTCSEPVGRMGRVPARRAAPRGRRRRRAGQGVGGLGVLPTVPLRCVAAATASPPACAMRSSDARPSCRRAGVLAPRRLVRSRWRRQRSPPRAVCRRRDPVPPLSISAPCEARMAGTPAAQGTGASPPLTRCQSPKGPRPPSG